MAAVLIPVVIVAVALIALALTARRFSRREQRHVDEIRSDRGQTIRYLVPNGQDPTAVIIGLDRAGYDAVPDPTVGQSNEILIAGRGEVIDRETVRQVLGGITRVNLEGDRGARVPPVQFMDE